MRCYALPLRGRPRLEINEGTSSSGVAIKAFLARLLVKLIIFGQSFIIVHCLQVTGPICERTSKKITDVLDNILAQIRWSMVIHVMPTSHGVHVRSYHVHTPSSTYVCSL